MNNEELKLTTRDNITDFFVNSHDFNGLHLYQLEARTDLTEKQIRSVMEDLVTENEIDLVFDSVTGNPHVKRIDDLAKEQQIKKIRSEPLRGICAYPKPHLVEKKIDFSAYNNQPFTKRLWRAEPQFTPVFFDLTVLQRYFVDARYEFEFDDFSGSISVQDKHYNNQTIADRDKIFLQTFGIGYDEHMNHVVIVYLGYLSKLSPEHQQYWQTFICLGKCKPNSDYHRASMFGTWPEHYSVYRAFLQEQVEINRLCYLIGRSPLFVKTYEEGRPKGFHVTFCPTTKNFSEFAHLLDKLISENINFDFFGDDIDRVEIIKQKDGSVERIRKNSLRMLDEWLTKFYTVPSSVEPISKSLAPLREIRKARQNPAHKIEDDEYDLKYVKLQQDLLEKAYHFLMFLRLIFSKHPYVSSYEPPSWLKEEKIVFY